MTTFRSLSLVLLALLLLTGNVLCDDLVRAETGVENVWNDFGVRGDSVVIAILDRGIDYEHPDFLNTDGTTRILYIYDMIDPTGANDPGNPYGIGTIYTEAQINTALQSGVRLATRDAVGHGTASAGLAGGNGAASNGLYAGMAPEAKFIIVKITSEGAPAHGNEPAEAAFYNPDYIDIAVAFVADKSAEVSMPAVMLANFGSSGGPMDGSGEIARALDARVGAGIPGLVFVTGSSDDGGVDNHAAGTVAEGDTIDLVINKVTGFLRLDLWYDENDRFDVEILTPAGNFGPYPSPPFNSQRSTRSTSEFAYYHNGSGVDFYQAENNKREIFIDFINLNGTITLRIIGAQVTNGTFQASLNPSTIFGASTNTFQSFVTPGYTVWDLASAFNNICPNSYVLRPTWTDIDGFTRTFPGNDVGAGDLWTGSGVGPTYDGRNGVHVSAPGNSNIAAYGQRSYFNTLRFNKVQPGNGFYGTLGAVSGAAPVLTGIIALILDANPDLDAIEVRDILQNTARSDAFTGTTPNPEWGYGKVDAYAAVQEALALSPIDPQPQVSKDIRLHQNYPNPFNPSTTIEFDLSAASVVTLQIYNNLGQLVQTPYRESQPAGTHKYIWNATDAAANPLPSGVYYYRLQAGDFIETRKMLLVR